jgi:hypothetical protein
MNTMFIDSSMIEHYNMESIDIPYTDMNNSPIINEITKKNRVGKNGEKTLKIIKYCFTLFCKAQPH